MGLHSACLCLMKASEVTVEGKYHVMHFKTAGKLRTRTAAVVLFFTLSAKPTTLCLTTIIFVMTKLIPYIHL